MSQPAARDPFGHLEGIVTFLLGLLIAGITLIAAIGVIGLVTSGDTGVSIAGIGDDQTCVPITNETPRAAASEVKQRGIDRDRATMRVEELDLCLRDSTVWQEAMSDVGPLGELVFAFGGLLLVRRAIRAGRQHGVFSPELAGRARQLGWFLLAMTVAGPVVVAAAQGVIVQEAIPGRTIWWQLLMPDVSLSLVVVAVGVLSVAQILRRGVVLQEDVDATV